MTVAEIAAKYNVGEPAVKAHLTKECVSCCSSVRRPQARLRARAQRLRPRAVRRSTSHAF